MKKNDVIKFQGNMYRVLSIKNNHILCIDCLKQNMPVWKNIPNEYESVSEEDLNTLLGRSRSIDELSAEQRKTAYQRFAVIAGIVAVIDDKQLYVSQIKAVSEAQNWIPLNDRS